MLPTDGEFLLLYAAYIIVLICLVLGYKFSKHKRLFKNNLLIYAAYTAIMIFIFADGDNFKYGASLSVLFYGGCFVVFHMAGFVLYRIFKAILRKRI